MRKEDLVVLLGPDNGNFIRLVKIDDAPKDLKIDVEVGTWSYKRPFEYEIIKKIGAGDVLLPSGRTYGVIGVFDQTNFEHVNNMIFAVQYNERQMHRPLGYDDL